MKEIAKGVCDIVEITGLDCNWRATEAVLIAIAGVALMLWLSWLASRSRVVRRLLDGVYSLAGVLAALFMIAMLLIICGQMIARWSSVAFPGSSNYAGYCMAASSFLGLAYALNQSAHIRVSLMLAALGRHRYWGELWCFGIGALLATYFARYAIKATILSEKLNDVSQGQDATPLWIPQIAMCVGGVLMAAALWDNLFTLIFSGRTNLREETVKGDAAPMEA